MPSVEIKLDLSKLDRIHRAAQDSALETVGAIRGEMVAAQVMPFDTGKLQDSGGAIYLREEGDEIHTELTIGDTPYARRLYFHPEYNFQKANNPNAQGEWTQHWLPDGSDEEFAQDTFTQRMEERLK